MWDDESKPMIELGDDISKEFLTDFGKSLSLFRDHIVNIDDDDPIILCIVLFIYENGWGY